jgi:hypothetical protein
MLDVLYGAVRAGYTPVVTQGVKFVTGRKPTSFDAVVRRNAAAGRL